MADFDFDTGVLRLRGGLALGPNAPNKEGVEQTAISRFQPSSRLNGFKLEDEEFFGHKFSVSAVFSSDILRMINLVWLEGPATKLGWDCQKHDLLKEKKSLSTMIQTNSGRSVANSTSGADTFTFGWGEISVLADLKSCCVYTSIQYG